MKSLVFLVAALVAAVSLASFAGSAKAAPCTTKCTVVLTNLATMHHEMLKAVVQNLRG